MKPRWVRFSDGLGAFCGLRGRKGPGRAGVRRLSPEPRRPACDPRPVPRAEGEGWLADTIGDVERLVLVFEGLGDDAGLAKTWRLNLDPEVQRE
jgi:hypothetical protein